MSLHFHVLGEPGGDNALLVRIDSGQAVERLLFDCGEGCLTGLPLAEIQAVDHLCFSHLHMDHVAGFDSFFRATFNRTAKPNHLWGPPGTARILQHRFQGFLWNLHEEMSASWLVTDIEPQGTRTARFELGEAFAIAHEKAAAPLPEGTGYTVEALTMNHRTPTIAYIVREKPRWNIDPSRLDALGLRPGPWLKGLKEAALPAAMIEIDGLPRPARELRQALLTETPGDSIAYLTDFLLDEAALERLTEALRGCRVIVCEGQYRHADLGLAQRHHHATTVQSATLARRAGVEELVLFHLSSRYERAEWREMIREARRIFPRTSCPPHWELDPEK